MRGQQEEKEPKSAAVGAPKENTVRTRKRKADVAIFLPDLDEESDVMTKKKHCEAEVSCSLEAECRSPHSWTSTPPQEEDRQDSLTSAGLFHYNFHNIFVTPVHCTPLPMLCWASKDVVWSNMLKKDRTYSKDTHMLEKHPHLEPKMRAILLDWLMEVSEVYKLHRETYHLAVDYFDRFMATQRNLFKSTLQLIGITCLFIAAKMEEMYPPKVHQFAYVTDEACTEDDILNMEIIIMKELNWSLSPQTPISWLNVYMQVAYLKDSEELLIPRYPQETFTQIAQLLIPRYPQETFTQIAQLLDLCMLDVRCLEFSNGILAASALFHFSSLELVENVSALKRVELEECVRWMVPFAMVLREAGGSPMKTFTGIATDDMHNIQSHSSFLSLLAKAQSYHSVDLKHPSSCPVPSGVLTPPLSSEKTDELNGAEASGPTVRPRMYMPPLQTHLPE